MYGSNRVLENNIQCVKDKILDSQSKIDFLLSMAKAKTQKGVAEDGKFAAVNFQSKYSLHVNICDDRCVNATHSC